MLLLGSFLLARQKTRIKEVDESMRASPLFEPILMASGGLSLV